LAKFVARVDDGAESHLLRVVARSSYCLAIADVARALRITRQAAHKLVYRAVGTGRLELLPNPDDRRILQVLLTPRGRAELASLQTAEGVWLQMLLGGLADRRMVAVTHVLRVIRQRLERDERERRRVEREERDRRPLSRDRFFR
jgi:DNA-binding MarR family transcriptional regulator